MTISENRRLFLVWLVLVAVTVFSWAIGLHHGRPGGRDVAVTWGVLLIAALKARLIIRQFMETAHASRLLRSLTDLWLVALLAILLTFYMARIGVTV